MARAYDIPGDHRRGRHVISALHVHVVFVTKYPRGVLGADMLACCHDAMQKVCGDFGAGPRERNGEDNHGHLLVEYPPMVAVAGLVNSLKGVPCTGTSGPRPTSPRPAAARR